MSQTEEFLKAFDKHADALFRHCFFRICDRERARDFVQEAFVKTWDYLSRGNEIKNFKPFLYRTVHNLIVDEARHKKTHALISIENLPSEDLKTLGRDERPALAALLDSKRLAEAIADLPENYRDAVTMRYIDDLTTKEIARILGVSENLVSVRIHRGLQILKKRFAYE